MIPKLLAKQIYNAIAECDIDDTHRTTFKLVFWTEGRSYVDSKLIRHASSYNQILTWCDSTYKDGFGWSLDKKVQAVSGDNPANDHVRRATDH